MTEKTVHFLKLTDLELFELSEFFNNEGHAMDDDVYKRIGRKAFVEAAKAGLYDETEWDE